MIEKVPYPDEWPKTDWVSFLYGMFEPEETTEE